MPDLFRFMSGIPWRLWAWFGAFVSAAIALAVAYGKGRKAEKDERNADDAQAYVKERRRQDRLDLGVGASDAERVRLLNEIADGGGAGNP